MRIVLNLKKNYPHLVLKILAISKMKNYGKNIFDNSQNFF